MGTGNTKGRPFPAGNQAAVGHGAPKGNRNAQTHGLKPRQRFSVGQLPKGCSWISTLVSGLRRELEAMVMSVHGAVGPKEALFIQSACRHEQAALLAQRWLRLEAKTMTHSERLTYLQAIASESDKRDRAVDRLRLDVDPSSIIDALYSAHTPTFDPPETKDAPKPATAPQGRTGDDKGADD